MYTCFSLWKSAQKQNSWELGRQLILSQIPSTHMEEAKNSHVRSEAQCPVPIIPALREAKTGGARGLSVTFSISELQV